MLFCGVDKCFPSGTDAETERKEKDEKRKSVEGTRRNGASLNFSVREVHCDKANLTWLGDKRKKKKWEKKKQTDERTDGQMEKKKRNETLMKKRNKELAYRRRIEEELNRNEQVTHTMIRHNEPRSLRPTRSWYIQFTELLTITIFNQKGRQKERKNSLLVGKTNLFKRVQFA